MAKDFFQFKQFTVKQDLCGMKVCTDSCILGAYAMVSQAKKILDIGTGTGLLALMTAQRSEAMIDAVEIDKSAFGQAQENIAQSPWKERIQVFNQAIQTFKSVHPTPRYDTIICNPPFFEHHLKSPQMQKNIALHNDFLSLDDLLQTVQSLLEEDGNFWVMLPFYEGSKLEELAKKYALYLQKKLFVYNRPQQLIFRVIQQFSFQKITHKPISEILYIKNESNQYSPEFAQLLKDYYLIF